jgi:hypothetical protein
MLIWTRLAVRRDALTLRAKDEPYLKYLNGQ